MDNTNRAYRSHLLKSDSSNRFADIYIYIYINVKKYNSTTRHLTYSYISILTNLLRSENETKSVKTICNYATRSIKKDKKDKQ